MAKVLESISPEIRQFIEQQHIYFVGTAAADGRVNVSPKGSDTFRVLDEHKVMWLNLTGSGNETAAHLLLNPRMTIMFCSFEKNPMILRLYGSAKIYHERDAEFTEKSEVFGAYTGARQVIEMDVDMVQTSCGFAVPFMDFVEDRETLNVWADKQGKEKIHEYWQAKNQVSIDGFETKILE